MRTPATDDMQSQGIAEQLAELGYARLSLSNDENERLTTLVQEAVAELRGASAFRPELHVAGDAHGLGAGYHLFPTNDPEGRASVVDGQFSGLPHTQTWDHRGGTNPDGPNVRLATAYLKEAAHILQLLASRTSRDLQSHPEFSFAKQFLETTSHNGVVLRTNVSRGGKTELERTATRHIWHSDATIWTLLCLQDYAQHPAGVSSTDRLVYETKEGAVRTVEPQVGDVILFPGRHLAALMDVSPPLAPWRHAVVSREFSERIVTMLRIGFAPDALDLRFESGRRLVTRDGHDVGSGAAFYRHLQALEGAPLILDGSPPPAHGHRGTVDDFELVVA